jgi:hypothetical protein
MQVQPLFDSWTLSGCPLPPRSRLYALEPIGIGTAFVESLSGYVARLAEAHSVSAGDLVGRVLSDAPNLKGAGIPPAARAGKRGGTDFESAAIPLTASQTRRRPGSTLWKQRRAAVAWGASLSFRCAPRCLTICFIGIGRGVRSVTNNGDCTPKPFTSHFSGQSKRHPIAWCTSGRSATTALAVAGC